MRGRSGLLLCLATAIVLISAIFLVQSEEPEASVELDGSSTEVFASQELSELRSPETPANERQSVANVQKGSSAELERLSRSIGASITVRVVDDATSEPVEGILLTLLCERPQTKSYGTAISDRNGRASFSVLIENMYLIRSMRRLPYAEALAAVWLPNGQHEDVILRLGTGGRLTGRVVDDRGAALGGATVLAAPGRTVAFGWNWISPERIALERRDAVVTDSEGRFRLDAMTSEAQGIWVVEGEVRPERFEEAQAVAKLESGRRAAKAFVKEGETVDVGDIVMDRLRTWRGRVIDESGAPVASALVSSDYKRSDDFNRSLPSDRRVALALAPGQPEFLLAEGESLTDGAGQFELSLRRQPWSVFIRSVGGQNDQGSFPRLKPGEVRNGIELVFEFKTLLSIELIDEREERIVRTHPEVSRQELRLGSYGGSEVVFLLSKPASAESPEDWESSRATASSAGIFRPSFETGPAAMGELLVFVPGYYPGRLRDATSAIGLPMQLQLETLPCVRLEMRVDEDWPNERFVELRRPTELVLSSVSPQARSEANHRQGLLRGLGSSRDLKLGVVPIQARMFVQEPGEYWAYLLPRSSYVTDEFEVLDVFGPFASNDERVNEVVVSSAVLESLVTEVVEEPSKLPPPPGLVPGEEAPSSELATTGRVKAFFQDLNTGEPVNGVRVVLWAGETARSLSWTSSKNPGRLEGSEVPAGTWKAKSAHWSFETWESHEFVLEAGEEVDLGTILLVPHPRLVGKLLEADGSPVPHRSSIAIHSAAGDGMSSAATGEGGAFELSVATTERVHARFATGTSSFSGSRQLSQFRCTSLTDLGDSIELDPWREVEFVLENLLDSERYLRGEIYIEAATCSTEGHHPPRVGELRSIGPQLDGRRVFRGRFGAGTYIPKSESFALGVRADPFEVVSGEGLQRIQLRVAR